MQGEEGAMRSTTQSSAFEVATMLLGLALYGSVVGGLLVMALR